MTERALSISTQIATPAQTALNSTTSVSANDALASTESGVEDYTIKCICDWNQDDGATVLCELCDTWQHIECFYPGQIADTSREDFDHSCADCKPRSLDRQRAIEYQRSQRQIKADNGDKKSKRAPSKSHKKKPKLVDVLLNGRPGNDDHRNGSPQDQASHSKRPKGHRSKESVSKRSPAHVSRQPSHSHGHPPSPAHTPPDLPSNFPLFEHSDHFIASYNSEEATETNTNSMASIDVANKMSSWLEPDEVQLRKDVGKGSKEVFQRLIAGAYTALAWPELLVDEFDVATESGVIVHQRCLRAPRNLSGGKNVAELNGVVELQWVYADDDNSEWKDGYTHSKPFVFYVPDLPLVVDARREGSKHRYIRRSCNANTLLETYIDPDRPVGYHFWLVSDRPISENEEVTLPWDFRFPTEIKSRFMHFLNLGEGEDEQFTSSDITDDEYNKISGLVRRVLSDFGGCACGLGNDCAFVRFHRNFHGKSQHPQTNGVKSKKGRKTKQSHVSPTSTGHATNSRAASEGHPDQYDDDDRRSVSASSTRSKPGSRDLTPIHSVGDNNGILSSDREKRKIAMVEDSFRKMEQGQPPRKKKRASDGTTNSSNSTQSNSKPRQRPPVFRSSGLQHSNSNANGGTERRQYVDASTSRRQSGSPTSATSSGPAARRASIVYQSRPVSADIKPIYVEASTQTDIVEDAWYNSPSQSPTPRKSIVPLSRRLLLNRHKLQLEQQAAQQMVLNSEAQSMETSPTVSMDLDTPMLDERGQPESPTDSRGRHASISSSSPSVDNSATADINMVDAPNITKPPPPPWPGQPIITVASGSIPGQRSPELRVQLPPTPTFSHPNMSGSASPSLTPSSAAASVAQSPFGTNISNTFPAPNGLSVASPTIKTTKKLSWSDYKLKKEMERANKINTSGATEASSGSSPTVTPSTLKTPLSTIEEIKAAGSLEVSTSEEEKPELVPGVSPEPPPTTNSVPSQRPNGIL